MTSLTKLRKKKLNISLKLSRKPLQEFVEEVEGEKKSAQELKKILSAEREELIKKYFK